MSTKVTLHKYTLVAWLTIIALLTGLLPVQAMLAREDTITRPAATITIDGNHEANWGSPLATDPTGDMTEPNLDLHRLYVAEDANNYYIGFDAYASSWGMTYGIYIDTDLVNGSGATSDPWGRAVDAISAHLPEYALYVWHVDTDILQDAQLATWSGGSWSNPTLISLGGEQGYGAANDWIEYKVPKAALGNPTQIALELFTTGGGGHAQDTTPSDSNVAYTDPDWGGDTTTLSAFAFFPPIIIDGNHEANWGNPLATDPLGDMTEPNLDLQRLYVTEDADNYYIGFDAYASTWGMTYGVYIDTDLVDESGATSDPWGRAVNAISAHRPEHTLYVWHQDSDALENVQLNHWDGANWSFDSLVSQGGEQGYGAANDWIEYKVPKAALGNPTQIALELFTTGGGGHAQDTVPSDSNVAYTTPDWGGDTTTLSAFAFFPPLAEPSLDNTVWWDGLGHNSRNSLYRQPFGAVTTNTPITLRFRTYANDVTGVRVRVWDTKAGGQTIYPMNYLTTIPGTPFNYDIWELQLDAPNYLTVLYYRFLVTDGSDTDYYEDDDLFDGGLGTAYNAPSPDYSWQIDVYDPNFDTPDWFKNAVVYQIFPDRFRNGVDANDPISGTFFYDETPGTLTAPQWNWIVPDPRIVGSPWEGSYSKLFYGGDLQGITDKLDYLQSLGVTALYLNPIFESPSNHKYDATSYEVIDDNFGDLATFITLTNELHNRGMYLVLDGVFNHTSSDSMYFDRYERYTEVGACEDVNSPYRSWYYFTPASPPGTGVCAGDTNYNAWWGYASLPKLNTTDNLLVRGYIYSDTPAVAAYWLTQGADGWRLDVAGDVAHSFWKDWRDDIRDAKANAITIAEEWGDASQFILGDELDSTMSYRFRNAIIGLLRETNWQDTNSTIRALSVSQFDSLMHSIEEDYPPEAFYAMMNLVGSHDVNRALIPLDQDGDPTDDDYSDGKARLRVLAIIQMTMPGAPTIYYGDEVGLVGYGDENGGGVFYSDPYNRQPFPWPDEPGYSSLPAWRQQDLSLQQHYSATASIRHAHPALRTGSFDTLLTDDDNDLYAYGRKLGNDAAVIAINRSVDTTQTITIDVSSYLPEGTELIDELNASMPYTVTAGQIVLADVPPMWGAILTVNAGQGLTPPDAPVLTATEGNGQVNLSWTVPLSAVVSYDVYRSYASGGGYTLIATATNTIYTDTGVTNGEWYYYVVTALGSNGLPSEYSNEAPALPHAPIGWAGGLLPASIVHTIGITPTEVITAQVWVDGITNGAGQGAGIIAEVGYGITGTAIASWTMWAPMSYYGDVDNNDAYSATLTPEMTGTYQYVARFSTTGGREWTTAYVTGTLPGILTVQASSDTIPPSTPLNLQVTDWGAAFVALAWTPITDDLTLYAYDIYRSEVSGTVGSIIGRALAPTFVYTDNTVSTGHTYYYVVQAVDTSFNRSGYSNQVEATPQPKLVAVTFQAVVPEYTPADATVYVVGDRPELCGWCNPQTIALEKTGSITWTKVITMADGQAILYKYTRGNWDVNEWWGPIVSTNNRHATVDYGSNGTQLLADIVYYWRDPLVISHYPANGATGIDTSGAVTATLSRYLDPVTLTGANLVLSNGVSTPTLAITYYYHTEMTATTIIVTPTTPLDDLALYTMTLKTGITGLNADNGSAAMARAYSWNFTTLAHGVMLEPSTDAQSGDPGATVTYTLRLTNTGDTLDTFTLTYAGNVWDVYLPVTQTVLGSGAGVDVVVFVTIPSNAAANANDDVTITATSLANSALSDSSQLTTSANAVYGVLLSPSADAQSGDPGGTVQYTLRVTNTGNAEDTFTMTVSGNAWATGVLATVGPLAAGAGADVLVTVDIPVGTSGGATDAATITATSQGDPTKAADSVLTTTADVVYGVIVWPSEDAKSGDPGTPVTYTLRLTNTGNAQDIFSLAYSGNVWDVSLPVTQAMLESGEGVDVIVHVTVPSNAAAGANDIVAITATSQGNSALSDASQLTTSANAVYGVLLNPPTDARSGDPGAMVTYTLRLTNTGNAQDIFSLAYSGNVWDVSLPVTQTVLEAGEGVDVIVHVTIPLTATNGMTDMASVTVTGTGCSNSSNLTTTAITEVEMYYIYLPLIMKNQSSLADRVGG